MWDKKTVFFVIIGICIVFASGYWLGTMTAKNHTVTFDFAESSGGEAKHSAQMLSLNEKRRWIANASVNEVIDYYCAIGWWDRKDEPEDRAKWERLILKEQKDIRDSHSFNNP